MTEYTNDESTVGQSGGRVTLTVNGKPVDLDRELLVTEFLVSRNLQDRLVVVELNGDILRKEVLGSTILRDGDVVEIVHFVGGGA